MKLLISLVLLVALVAVGGWLWTNRSEVVAQLPGQREQASPQPSTTEHPRYIRSVDVQITELEGQIYVVRPTKAGRLVDSDALDEAWNQAVQMGVPNQPGLRDQFRCHPLSIVARAKPTWDLEVFRPEVGLRRTMLAGCNPT